MASVVPAGAPTSGEAALSTAPRPNVERGADAVWARRAWLVGAIGAAGLGLYLFGPTDVLLPVFLVVSASSITAVAIGALRHAPVADRRPWWALVIAMSLFFGGAIVRALLEIALNTQAGWLDLVPDSLIVPGYLVLAYVLLDLLKRRRSAADDTARVDAVLIGLGAAFATWTFFIAPRIAEQQTRTAPELVVAFFPVIDVLLVVLVLRLMLSGGKRSTSMWMIGSACAVMFVADLVFVVQKDAVLELNDRTFDALFMFSYLCMAVAALHPSMRRLTEAQRTVIEDLSPARIAGIAAVLITPAVVATLSPPTTTWNAVVRIALSVLFTVAVLIRIVRANNSRARAEQAARRRATHDPLTDLPNRELLADTVARWCDRATEAGQEISLLFLDLDRFKMVNDHWGHEVGDELLCAVAGRLGAMVRSEDLVCRIGGDEFVIALASPSHSRLAESLANRLLAEFAEPFTLSVGNVVITPSIGVALSEGAGEALTLIRDADTAMYKAKGSGRNKYAMFDTSLRDLLHTRVRLEQALRGALERGELAVFYQPIIDLETDELTGFEALMRWHSPQLGAVSPLDFIPIAEETGLIEQSGAWLFEQAAGQLVSWIAERPAGARELHMSVNVSVRQLRDARLVTIVRDVLRRTGLPPDALWLEITESGVMEDLEVALSTLSELRGLGVTLSIDDFGTGYSSLSYLNRLPVGILKIDRSFINGVGEDGPNEPIVRAVLAMAHAMRHQVVAEGVETAVQRDWLRALGCDFAQGYLYSAPRPAVELGDWIRRSSAEAQVGTRVVSVFPGAA